MHHIVIFLQTAKNIFDTINVLICLHHALFETFQIKRSAIIEELFGQLILINQSLLEF